MSSHRISSIYNSVNQPCKFCSRFTYPLACMATTPTSTPIYDSRNVLLVFMILQSTLIICIIGSDPHVVFILCIVVIGCELQVVVLDTRPISHRFINGNYQIKRGDHVSALIFGGFLSKWKKAIMSGPPLVLLMYLWGGS